MFGFWLDRDLCLTLVSVSVSFLDHKMVKIFITSVCLSLCQEPVARYEGSKQVCIFTLAKYNRPCWRHQENFSVVPFLALRVLLQRVEKIPSVQSLVATSSLPNICGAVIALGFILISRCGEPVSVMAFIKTWMQLVLPAPEGPSVIIPWRTRCVSNNWNKRRRIVSRMITWSRNDLS